MYNDKTFRSYDALIAKVGEVKFKERLEQLIKSANEFIEIYEYNGVKCNERIMLNVLLDYYVDVFRLKEFHEIEHTKLEKVTAYTISWILRRKPIQFVGELSDEKDIFINERFAFFLMINECFGDRVMNFSPEHKQKLDDYMKLVLYYFKYRDCNPQAIELAIESFKMGMLLK